MDEIIEILPFGVLFAYFMSNFLFRSFLIQKTLPTDLAPNWMNKDIAFLLMIFNELIFVYWCYSLLIIPEVNTWYGIVGILILRFFVNWVAKVRALGVYVGYLTNLMKSFSESSEDYRKIQEDIKYIQKNHNAFFAECKSAKRWKGRD